MTDEKLQKPEIVLDGRDMNQDIHQLIGYCWDLGNTEKEFPASHCCELATEFLKKHRKTQGTDMFDKGETLKL